MLSADEKRGCADLLYHLDLDELLMLAKTVTKMAIGSRQEAVKVIVSCTETPADILRRQKIKKETLLKYLLEENVSVSSNASKHTLAQAVSRHWGSTNVIAENFIEIEDVIRRPTSVRHTTSVQHTTSFLSVLSEQTSTRLSLPQSDTCLAQPFTCSSPVPSQKHSTNGSENSELAVNFTKWYYEMVNSYHPSATAPPTQYFGPQHFYSDCTLQMRLIGQNNVETCKKVEGSQQTSIELLDLVRVNHIRFQPNTNVDGLQLRTDLHGLVVAKVCGTLHKNNKLAGLFEQEFGLAKDPSMQGNYLIKYTNLQCRET